MPLFVITIGPLHRSDNSKTEKLIITSPYIYIHTHTYIHHRLLRIFYNKLIILHTLCGDKLTPY